MKNLFKKTLACCLVVCMVLTLCISAITVNAEVPSGSVTVGEANIKTDATTATVDVTVSVDDVLAAAKVAIKVPTGLTISGLALTADDNVDVTYASAAEPNGKPISLAEATEFVAPNIIDGAFNYVIHLPAGETTANDVVVSITFAGTFAEGTVAVEIAAAEACFDAVSDLIALTLNNGAINVTAAHVCAAARTEQENVNQATCYAEGSYDEVVYCSCGKELSRTPKTIDKIAHTPATAVVENEVAATCYAKGSYDSVVYCSVEACKFEISRTSVPVDETEHTPATAVVENEVAATCLAAGSYESVVYCSVAECKHEISRTTLPIAKLDHVFGDNLEFCANNCGTANPDYVAPCAHANKTLVSAVIDSYVEEQGTVIGAITFKCDDCDQEFPAEDVTYLRNAMLAGTDANILLDEMTELKLRLNNNNYGALNAKDLYVVYTQTFFDGSTKTIELNIDDCQSAPTASKNEYSWSLPVDFDKFADDIEVHVFRQESDGSWVSGLVRNYSVKKSAMNVVKGASSAASDKKICANLLRAGAECQLLADKNLDPSLLVDNELVGEYANLIKTGVPTVEQTETNWKLSVGHKDLNYAYFTTPTVLLGETVKLSAKLDLRYVQGDITDLKIMYTYTAYDGTVMEPQYIYAEDLEYLPNDGIAGVGRYALKFGVKAPDMRSAITFRVYNGDTVISNDIIYSLEGTFRQALNSAAGPKYKDAIEALMNYSDTVVEEKTK